MENLGQLTFARQWGDEQTTIGLALSDRRYHMLLIGRTGTGKSSMLANMIYQDMRIGRSIGLIDPHGDLSKQVLALLPTERRHDLIYLNPADFEMPVGFNPLMQADDETRHLIAANLMSVFRKIWRDSWGPRMSYLLHNAILALLETPGNTLLSLQRLLTDKSFRERIVHKLNDPVVKHYWQVQFAAFPERQIAEITSPVLNKIGAYLTNGPLRNMLGQYKSTIRFDRIMNNGGILIADLAKGRIGEDAANLLGSLLVTNLQLTAMARASLPEDERRDFYLYVDEFHNFTTESFADILAEARKYRLNLIMAHQYLGQLSDKIRDAVLSNAGTMVVFRVGPEDARVLAKEFGGDWPETNLVNLNPYEVYCKVMRHGVVSGPIQAGSFPPPRPLRDEAALETIIALSHRRYGRKRESVEKRIVCFFETDLPKKQIQIGKRRKQ